MQDNLAAPVPTARPANRAIWWILGGCLVLLLFFFCCVCTALVAFFVVPASQLRTLPPVVPAIPTLPAIEVPTPPAFQAAPSGVETPEAGAELASGSPLGQAAPDLALEDLSGKTWRLGDLRGKPIVVNFWATWCPPCREEMPALEEAWQRSQDQGLVILAVDVDEPTGPVAAFAKRLKLTFTILAGGRSGQIAQAYRVRYLPTSYFVDAEGVIRAYQVGGMTAADIDRNLAKIGVRR